MLRWKAQHMLVSRPSASAFHPAIVSGAWSHDTTWRCSGMTPSEPLG